MVDQGRIAEGSRSERVKMFNQEGFARGSRYDHAKRELPTADYAKAIDQGEMAEWLAEYRPTE